MRYAIVAILILSGNQFCLADGGTFSASYEKLELPASTPEFFLTVLSKDALVVRSNGNDPIMKIWFRDPIPVQANAEQEANGLTYREIRKVLSLGSSSFPKLLQTFVAGDSGRRLFAPLRVQPDIGDHTDTAPHPDFCLMCKVASEKSLERVEKKDLISLSSEVNEGKHPAVLLLFPKGGKEMQPKVVRETQRGRSDRDLANSQTQCPNGGPWLRDHRIRNLEALDSDIRFRWSKYDLDSG